MKKIFLLLAMVAGMTLTMSAQNEPFKIISMEEVSKTGSKCDYDAETCTAHFTGNSDRWFDIPGVQGDLTEHSKVEVDVLKSNVLLRFVVRYINENGERKEQVVATLYGQMGKSINKKKTLKVDLAGEGGKYADILKNVTAIRISMGKPCEDAEEGEEWLVKFGTQFIIK